MRTTRALLGLSALGLLAAASSGKTQPSTKPEPAGPPPIPDDFPTRLGGYKAPAVVTGEMSSVAASVLAQHPAVGTMTDFVADDGKTYGAWVTYHLKGNVWVRAVEIWEKT